MSNPPDNDQDLRRLADAMEVEHERNLKELTDSARIDPGSQMEELAKQIAEDQALAEEEAREKRRSGRDYDDEKAPLNTESTAQEIQAAVETLLFLSDRPLSLKKMRDALCEDLPPSKYQAATDAITEIYADPLHGVELAKVSGGYQLRTKVTQAAVARRLAKVQTHRLSRGAMETLAVIAYRGPVLKEDIDKVRGVDSSHFVRVLLEKKLISMSGRSELPGRPIIYETSNHFFEVFGVSGREDLPPLRELEDMIPASQSENPEDEDPKIKKMRQLVNQMKSSGNAGYDPAEDEKFLQDIRERVKGIPSTTPYIEEQKAKEKEAKQQAAPETDELPLPTPEKSEPDLSQ